MHNESPGRPDEPKMAVTHESDPSHTERAVADLEKSQAELAHVIGELGGRLAPVTAYTDSPVTAEACSADPSERSQLVRSIREAVDRTQRMTRRAEGGPMTVLAPWRPPAGPAARPEVARRYLADMRRRLHRDEFPLVTARHDVDQALAATERRS